MRELVDPLDSENENRVMWEETSRLVVDMVISHKRKVRETVQGLGQLPSDEDYIWIARLQGQGYISEPGEGGVDGLHSTG